MKKSILLPFILICVAAISQPTLNVDVYTNGNTKTFVHIYMPEDYGADDDSTTDDTEAFRAMRNAMPQRGGAVSLAAKTYLLNDSVIWNKPVTIIGQGRNDNLFSNAATLIKTESPNINVWEFRTSNFCIRDLSIENRSSTPLSGSSILVTGPVAKNGSGSDYSTTFLISNISVNGGYNGINVQDAYQYTIENSYIYSTANDGIVVRGVTTPDGGDSKIINCYFYPNDRAGVAGVHQFSSGGLTITACKFNGGKNGNRYQYCYLGEIEATTVILILSGNSYENFSRSAIRLIKNGGSFKHVSITGGQIEPYVITGYPYVDIDGISNVCITGLVIGGNAGTPDRPISVTNCDSVTLLNSYWGFTNATPVTTGSIGLHDLNNVTASTNTPADLFTDNFITNGNLAGYNNWAQTIGTVNGLINGGVVSFESVGSEQVFTNNTAAITNVQNGSVQLTVSLSAINTGLGVVFRQANASNYYLMQCFYGENNDIGVSLFKKVNGSYSQIGTSVASQSVGFGQTFIFKVAFSGTNITGSINGTQYAFYTDDTYTTGGKVGLRHDADGTKTVTNFIVN